MKSGSWWLSADWGTTNFRLRLVEAESLKVLSEVISTEGIASVYQQWKSEAGNDALSENRIDFYKRFLLSQIRKLETKSGHLLGEIPVIVSGMAGSSIGMTTLPYQPLPSATDGSGLYSLEQPPAGSFPFSLVLVSGLCTADDVMRGEETMLVGAIGITGANASGWYLFPGTHSKHIFVSGNQISQLRTYMTGELFALLAEKSILAASVEKPVAYGEPAAFAAGLEEGWSGRLSHSLFLVRTADLLGTSGKAANYEFLSGLLIGHELRDLPPQRNFRLVGEGPLLDAYAIAFRQLFPEAKVEKIDGPSALIHGQWRIVGQSAARK